jgi:hypothetical protein
MNGEGDYPRSPRAFFVAKEAKRSSSKYRDKSFAENVAREITTEIQDIECEQYRHPT